MSYYSMKVKGFCVCVAIQLRVLFINWTGFCACSFDFCQSEKPESPVENLGQVVFGERIKSSPYTVGVQIEFFFQFVDRN